MKEKHFDSVTIMSTDELAPYFREYTQAKVITPSVHPNLITKNTKHKLLSNVIKSKIEYKKLFGDVKNEEIYAFFTSWSIVFFSYMKKLSKHNTVYFYLSNENYNVNFDGDWRFKKEKGILAFFMKMFAKIFLGVDVFILRKGNALAWELQRNSFPMKIVNYNPKREMSNEYMKMTSSLSIRDLIKDKDILFLTHEVGMEDGNIDDVIKITDQLMDILDTKFSDRYIIKPHPRETILYGKAKQSKHIMDAHILSETLMDHSWKYVIGYYSDALNSTRMFNKATSVSLMNFWKWNRQDLKQFWIDKYSESGVLMPKTIKELKEILEIKS